MNILIDFKLELTMTPQTVPACRPVRRRVFFVDVIDARDTVLFGRMCDEGFVLIGFKGVIAFPSGGCLMNPCQPGSGRVRVKTDLRLRLDTAAIPAAGRWA